jgi:hypothetical protein
LSVLNLKIGAPLKKNGPAHSAGIFPSRVDVQWTRTRFALAAQARNIGNIHTFGALNPQAALTDCVPFRVKNRATGNGPLWVSARKYGFSTVQSGCKMEVVCSDAHTIGNIHTFGALNPQVRAEWIESRSG